MNVAISKNRIPIRLNAERWQHITTGHPEIADYYYEILDTIENPTIIYQGNNVELIAVKQFISPENKYVVAIYKEISSTNGFIITAFLSNKISYFKKRKILWELPK